MNVEHNDDGERGKFFIKDDNDEIIAEMTYFFGDAGSFTIDHTLVDKEYGGKGLGTKLVDAAAEHARTSGKKVRALCPFAKRVLERSAAYADVYVR